MFRRSSSEFREKVFMDPKQQSDFDDFLKAIGENIRRIRKAKGLSQMDLHYKSDVSRDWISDIENGRINASIQVLYKIATALNTDIHELFLRSGTQE